MLKPRNLNNFEIKNKLEIYQERLASNIEWTSLNNTFIERDDYCNKSELKPVLTGHTCKH